MTVASNSSVYVSSLETGEINAQKVQLWQQSSVFKEKNMDIIGKLCRGKNLYNNYL